VGPTIVITLPGNPVATFSFPVEVELVGDFVPGTLLVSINFVDVTSRFSNSGGSTWAATIDPGQPLQNENNLFVRAQRQSDGEWITRGEPFDYLPPGKASAKQIDDAADLIRGPLANSQVGDWLLENAEARFIVQDVEQRELYSVGQYGGNIIDAELVADPGKDNFLELQAGLNIETVINAQTVEIVNDGQDGAAAVIRTCGPDDLLDFVNPSSQVTDVGLPFPPLADDKDLEIEGCNEYSLEPGKTYVRVDTEVFSNYDPMAALPPDIPNPLPLIVGDWLNPAGQLDTVARAGAPPAGTFPAANGVGPAVTSSLGTLGFYGFGDAAGVDYAFTQVPLEENPAVGSFVFISGVLVVLHSQNALRTLLNVDPILFTLAPGESRIFTRFFGVGDGSGSNAFDLENEVKGNDTGTLEGCVTVAGTPVAGARVSVGTPLGTQLPAGNVGSDKLFTHFTTKAGGCPNYSGTVAIGNYLAAAGREGHLYIGGGSAPPLVAVAIASSATTNLDFALPQAGRLQVNTTDAAGDPIPARVTVVGFDPSPEVLSPGPSLPGFGGGTVGLLNDVSDGLPFGVVQVGYSDASGTTEFDLEPGADLYHVYVSRGTEYSAFRTAMPITITAGNTTVVNGQIARVLGTPGFVSSDFHVHGIRSADSRVTDVNRVRSYSAEGIENVVMTDHHHHSDLNPEIADRNLDDWMTSTIGEEITTFDYGHFNAYPLLVDANALHPTFTPDGLMQLSGGSTDWAQAAPPGMDFPSHGALNAVPSVIHDLATMGSLSVPGVSTIQINHIDSHFAPLKIDTSLVPPQDLMTDEERATRRLPDTATVDNLFFAFPALELWNGDSRGDQNQFLDERIGIWMNLLSQGYPTTFIADTDSHSFTNQNSAGARTWTASPTDDPSAIDPADVADSVDAGRATGGQGIFVTTRLLGGAGDVADLTWGGDTSMSDGMGDVTLEIEVESPSWAQWDTIEIYANATTTPLDAMEPYLYDATPTQVLAEGDCDPSTVDGDFEISVDSDVGGVVGADRWRSTLNVPLGPLAEDTWVVVVVKGTDGQCEPMFPVYPDSLNAGTNVDLEDLVDGNLGEGGTMALGATNALYFVAP